MDQKAFAWLLLGIFFALPLTAQRKKAATAEPTPEKHYLDTVSLGLQWRSVGPAITSGRIADIAVHPGHRGTYYVATASGGVWKTVNAGTTYEPVFDGEGSYSIGCITLDPNNPQVVWVGTGENNNQRSVAYGDGVYRSRDGGRSWEHLGLPESEHIGKIIVDPRHSEVVYVAAIGPLWKEGGERGVYKTTDGGKTWEQVLRDDQGNSLLDAHTGVTDLVMDPRDPDVLYAAAFQRRRHVFTYVGGGPGSTIYRSADGGKTWEKAARGLPGGDIGRIGLAISPADPEIIYAMVEAAEGGGFFRSDDRGASWQKQSGYATSGNYYCEIFAHPTEPNTVVAMDVFNQVSRDGGKSWNRLGEQFKHVDNHVIWIDPDDTSYFLAGCDGGVYESFDAGATWKFHGNLPVTQFYKVEVDNTLPFYHIHGGTQDNFSLGGPSRTRNGHGITNADWYVTSLGDGFESQIDPNNPDIVYAQAQHGVLVRYDRKSGEMTSIQPQPADGEDSYRWNWDAPLAVSHHQPTRLYFCANKVFRSDDRGNAWTTISGDLTRQIDRNTLPVMGRIQSIDAVAKNQSTSEYGNIVAFSESPLNPELLYAGTDDGLVQVTEDGGKSWHAVGRFPDVPEFTYVNMLVASRHDENLVYACFNNHKRGDFRPYVLKSTDKGRTWQSIHTNLPERGSAYSLAEDHVRPGLLFVGTEFSFFFTVDGGRHWKKLSAGLPTVAVRDIAIQRRENDIVLGTFGRGFYVLDDYSPLRELSADNLQAPARIFPVKTGLLYVEAAPIGYTTGKGFQGAGYFTASNPPVGATFTYFIKDDYKTLKSRRQAWEKQQLQDGNPIRYPTYEELEAESRETAPYLLFTFRTPDGELVHQIKTSPKRGVHRIGWNGRYTPKDPVRLNRAERMPWQSPEGGGLVMPGDYTVSLDMVAGDSIRSLVAGVPFTLETLTGSTLPAEDRPALDAYIRETAELERAWRGATAILGDIENRLRHIQVAIQAVGSPADLLRSADDLSDRVYLLRKQFYGDDIAARLDIPSKPALSNRVWASGYDIWSATAAPTATQQAQLSLASRDFQEGLRSVRNLWDQHLMPLEEALEKARAPYTPGRMPSWGRD